MVKFEGLIEGQLKIMEKIISLESELELLQQREQESRQVSLMETEDSLIGKIVNKSNELQHLEQLFQQKTKRMIDLYYNQKILTVST